MLCQAALEAESRHQLESALKGTAAAASTLKEAKVRQGGLSLRALLVWPCLFVRAHGALDIGPTDMQSSAKALKRVIHLAAAAVTVQDLEISELRQRLRAERNVRKACQAWLQGELKSRVSAAANTVCSVNSVGGGRLLQVQEMCHTTIPC
jgi:hypothetical protein